MPAGLVDIDIKDGNGVTRTARFWSSDGTVTGDLYPPTILNTSAGTEIDFTTGTAGSPAGGVTSVQGVSGGTPLRVQPSGLTAVGANDTTTNPVLIGGKQQGLDTVNMLAVGASGAINTVAGAKGSQVPLSATTLGIGATYTSSVYDAQASYQTTNAFYYNAAVYANQAGTLRIEFSYDNATWYTAKTASVVANTYTELFVKIVMQYYRTVYVNGGVANTIFNLASSRSDV